jgi:TRAP-type transport system periplasmic protein
VRRRPAGKKAAFRERAQAAVREWVVEQVGPDWPDKLDAAIGAYRGAG